MAKGNYVEVAPSLLISPQRKPSLPRLETILEEGPQQCDVIVSKRIVVLLPVLLSSILYFFLYRNVA